MTSTRDKAPQNLKRSGPFLPRDPAPYCSAIDNPSGQILHDGNVQEEMIPIEVDFDLVRRQRERGLKNMGQVLKSYRDRSVNFDVYSPDFDHSYLNSLGPLERPGRASLPDKIKPANKPK